MKQKSHSEEDLFEAALQFDSDAERVAFLVRECGSNATLRQDVLELLRGYEDASPLDEAIPIETLLKDIAGSAKTLEEAGKIISHYKLLEKLGEGGFGTVWVAEQQEPVKRRVALKIIKVGMDTKQVVARFEAERQALAMMDHPNIAKVFDAGATETGRPYFVMELVRGVPITNYCDEEKLSTEDRLDLFIKVCHAVQHAHQKGIIHRDLKPSNILVVSHDGIPVPKVIDFGIAKATHQELSEKTVYTKFKEFIGTPAYMSPEQAKLSGLDIDTRSDVYTLGVLLYELLTGTTPFDAKTLLAAGLDEMRRIIREQEPQRPSTKVAGLTENDKATAAQLHSVNALKLVSDLRDDLDWIVMKCLEKERTRRYDTANGLAMDLLRHLNHEPIVARPPSKGYRLQKSWQRNKLLFTAGVAVALSLLAGIAVSTWQARVATGAKTALQHGFARQLLVRGQSLCEQGKVTDGLHWMVQAYEKTPFHSQTLLRDIQNNLLAWSPELIAPETHLIHDSPTIKGTFSPDSQSVVTGSWSNGDLTLWSLATGEAKWKAKAHDGMQIWSLAFSSDGTRLLSKGKDKKIQLRSTETGEQLGQTMGSGSARFTQDSRSVILISEDDNTAHRFSALTGEALSPPQRFEDATDHGAFGANGRLKLIAGADNTTATFWDVESIETRKRILDGVPSGKIEVVALDPSGEKVAVGCEDGFVHVWAVTTGERLFVRRHKKRIQAVKFSPGGERLLTASDDGTARLWNTGTGEPVGDPMQHDAGVYAGPSFSPDGRRVVTASLDACARLWSTETAEPLGRPLRHQDNWVMSAFFSPDNKHLLTLTGALVAYVWNATEAVTPIRLLDRGEGLSAVRFSPNGRWLATGNHGQAHPSGVKIFESTTHERVAQGIVHSGGIWSVCFSPDCSNLATAGADGKVRVWDVAAQQERFQLDHDDDVRVVTYSPDGGLIATGSFDRTARIWSASSGEQLGASLLHPDAVDDLAFGENAQARILVTACADGRARVWSVEAGKEILPPLEHGAALLAVDIGLDDSLIATGGRDKVVKIWKVSDGKATGVVLVHDGPVEDLAFSKNGRWLLTTSRDGNVRLWSAKTGLQVGPSLLRDPSAGPWESCFSPDEKQVAIADHQNGAIIVELPGPLDQPHPDPRLWIEVITRMAMDEHGTLTFIEPDDWLAKREQLTALNVPFAPQ